MEKRVLFRRGKQRAFLARALKALGSPSLRALSQFGFRVPYGTLKCYYSEKRLLPRSFFENICLLAKLSPSAVSVRLLAPSWGQVKGGKKSRRRKIEKIKS